MWTFPPSRVLVPVDFSEASGRAVEVAAALAAKVGAGLHLLHVEALEVPAYFTHDQMKALEREQAVARARANEFLGDFARRHGAGTFTTSVVEGLPTPTILENTADADLVVMGTHGRRGPALWWLGSVAERVVHDSKAPVLVVRSGAATPPLEVFQRPVVFAGQSGSRSVSGERGCRARRRRRWRDLVQAGPLRGRPRRRGARVAGRRAGDRPARNPAQPPCRTMAEELHPSDAVRAGASVGRNLFLET